MNASKSCEGKTRYTSRARAKRVYSRLKGQGVVDGRLQAYLCEFCGYFHLGHIPVDVRRGKLDKAAWRAR